MPTKLVVLLCTLSFAAFADFKLTQTTKIEMNSKLPMPAAASGQMKSMLEPKVTVMELQGQNMRSRLGRFEILYLLESGVMHVIDVEKSQYATVSMSEWDSFVSQLQNPKKDPAITQSLEKMGNMDWLKINLQSKGKGDAGDVAGLGAEVDLYDLKFEISGTAPDPMMARAMGSQKMRIAYWTAPMPPSYAEMGSAQRKFMEMFGATSGVTKQQGGKRNASPFSFGEPFMKLQDEYNKKGRLMVKMVMQMFMDFSAMGPVPEHMKELGDEPFMTMTIDTKSFSDEPLDPKMFVVPSTFRAVGIDELDLQGLIPGVSESHKKAAEPEPKN
jgi:hypothetical protein